MWPEAPKGAAQPSMITDPCHGPGNKSAHKPFAASERLLCKSQAFEHLLRRKIFSEEVDSLFCLPWFKPATSFYTHSANNHSLGLPCIDILGLTCEMKGGKKKSLPHLGGKYLLESSVSIMVTKGDKTGLHSFPRALMKDSYRRCLQLSTGHSRPGLFGQDTSAGSPRRCVVKDSEESRERGRGSCFQGALFLSVRTSVTDTGNNGSSGDDFKDESSSVSRNRNQSRRPRIRTPRANHRRESPSAPLLKMIRELAEMRKPL